MSNIINFYSGQSVFITGATGFMGKVLLEKILRCMPDIKTVYILLRPKKGLSPNERIKNMLQEKPFTLNQIDQSQFDKVVALSGDISEDNLGLSEEDKMKIVNDVSIVLHLAASVRFDLSLHDAVKQNVSGTKAVLDLCKEIKNLKSVVHLSTAYCNVDIDDVEEKVYDVPNTTPYKIMDAVQLLNEEDLSRIQDNLIAPHPNTYTFTKRLAEIVAKDEGSALPLVIVRPSIVLSSYKEPAPGWIDTWYGPSGVFVAAGKGVLQVTVCDKDSYPQAIPVDIAINLLLIASYVRSVKTFTETPVYNATQTQDYKYTWGYTIKILMDFHRSMPLKQVLWHCNVYLTKNKYLYKVLAILLHFLPAFVIDFMLIMALQEPFLVKVHQKLHHGQKLLAFFTTRSFQFRTDNMEKLVEYLNDEDHKYFYAFDQKMDAHKFFLDCYVGGRHFLLNDVPDGNIIWTVRYYIYYILDKLLKLWLIYGFSKLILGLVRYLK